MLIQEIHLFAMQKNILLPKRAKKADLIHCIQVCGMQIAKNRQKNRLEKYNFF